MKKPGSVTMMSNSITLAGLILVAVVRPSAANAPTKRFTVSGGMVTDTKTGLVWQQIVPTGTSPWLQAGMYCTSNMAGLTGSGWRLPSLTELQTIVDDSRSNPATDPAAFPSTPIAHYWTSSTAPDTPGFAWAIGFSGGYTGNLNKTAPNSVRCVR